MRRDRVRTRESSSATCCSSLPLRIAKDQKSPPGARNLEHLDIRPWASGHAEANHDSCRPRRTATYVDVAAARRAWNGRLGHVEEVQSNPHRVRWVEPRTEREQRGTNGPRGRTAATRGFHSESPTESDVVVDRIID